jgi:hypothetical protein
MIVPVLLLFLGLIFAYIGSRRELSRLQLLVVLAFFATGALAVVFSGATMRVAAFFGVGRGADLLLYFSVLCGVLIAAHFYFRFKETERVLAELVRGLAIQSPIRPDGQ